MKKRLMLLAMMALTRVPAYASELNFFGRARIVPAFREGVCEGFKIFELDPHSVLAEGGMINGDVLHSVNGHLLTSPEATLEALGTSRKGDLADFEVIRGSQVIHLTVRMP